jgi:anaerobic selenocysteine-containing dehydrogenase
MRFSQSSAIPMLSSFDPELRVVQYVATQKGDAERGPQVRLNPVDAKRRLLVDGELVWVKGERGQQIAPLVVDETVAEYTCVLRDVAGVVVSEAVRVSKPDLDSPQRSLA